MPGTKIITRRVSFATAAPPSTPPTPKSPANTPPTTPLASRRQKEAELARTPTRELFKTLVTIHVGPNRQAFPLFRELLCHTSPFFAAAFDRDLNFSESSSGSLALPEIRPIDFEYLVQWLYTHTLNHEELEVPKPAYFKLIWLYILADQLHIEGLKNDVIDEIIRLCEKWNSVPTGNDTQLIDANTMPQARIRTLTVDLFVHKKTDVLVETHEDPWAEPFLRKAFADLHRSKRMRPSAPVPYKDAKIKCQKYHEHQHTPLCPEAIETEFIEPEAKAAEKGTDSIQPSA